MFKLSGGFQILWELENSLEMNNSLGTNSNWRLSGAKKKKIKPGGAEGPSGFDFFFFLPQGVSNLNLFPGGYSFPGGFLVPRWFEKPQGVRTLIFIFI
jgi:hypothetical protein